MSPPGTNRLPFARTLSTWSTGGAVPPERFCRAARRGTRPPRGNVEPRGPLSAAEAAEAIASRRAVYEVRAAHSPDTRHLAQPRLDGLDGRL